MRGLKQKDGFTLIELLVVIMIIGILLSITLFTNRSMQTYADDGERRDDIASIARRLEQAYANQETGAPSYPSTQELVNDAASLTGTMSGVNGDIVLAPGETASSVTPATTTDRSNPRPGMTVAQYVYQPLTADGSLCTKKPSTASVADNCVRFTLFYRTALGPSLQSVVSRHQQ